jgi:hypothetical protein
VGFEVAVIPAVRQRIQRGIFLLHC